MVTYTLIEAPSILGLTPSGVERLPIALQDAGLGAMLRAKHAGRVDPLPYSPERDPETHMLNARNIREYSIRLADAIGPILDRREFPIVLGGDCSILLGSMLAVRRRGRYGLLFLDGHMDFYPPAASPTGEAADMDLALATGRGPDLVTNLEGYSPLVRDDDTVVLGYRDSDAAASEGGIAAANTSMMTFDLNHLRRIGVDATMRLAIDRLARDSLQGFWIHLDADVLDDAVMPAVDYRMPGGLSFEELSNVLRMAVATQRAIGLEITIFNPSLDSDGRIAEHFARCITAGLSQASVQSG